MGDRLDYLNKACDLLEQNENVLSLKKSNLYETKAWGYTDQADFLNMCVEIETSLLGSSSVITHFTCFIL